MGGDVVGVAGRFHPWDVDCFSNHQWQFTGPLQLSSLYQGYQQVQLSMERLSDIIDQNPELARADDADQIALPSIQGVRFEDVKFRFGSNGPYQVDRVSVSIETGSFVGIVSQSGSGKSTLMKLLPRLYEPEQGRIFIDDYDIAKVNLSSLRRQIGIVPQDSLLFEGSLLKTSHSMILKPALNPFLWPKLLVPTISSWV